MVVAPRSSSYNVSQKGATGASVLPTVHFKTDSSSLFPVMCNANLARDLDHSIHD
jgi:hypothetical protein